MSQSNQRFPLIGLFTGKVVQNYGITTAMAKQLVSGRIFLSETGLVGDECAEPKFHGGTERALHQYPQEHYAFWQQQYPERAWPSPGMGENLSTRGMLEEHVRIGDQYQWGEAIIEISQPRSPCFKVNHRWDVPGFSEVMQTTGKCGWLYRVIQTGEVSAAAPLVLIRPGEARFNVKQVLDWYFNDPMNPEKLRELQACQALSKSWKSTIEKRLTTGELENWQFRLNGKPSV
ncbi:MOSC domain-containing protein [Photobacterium sp. GJ3]|uniref:MOSC domain-containing protein n=1 Tax=Photobacterium sp. GJ3 TaxID=2829502 RepID=UPI0020120E08|nr:MOSC domain-containing protein [Photobacterium sp. GJ3]